MRHQKNHTSRARLSSAGARILLLVASCTALIVGAACQPLQPAPGDMPGSRQPAHTDTGKTTAPATAPGAATVPAVPSRPSAPAGFVSAAGPAKRVALILPLSGRREAAGIAVRDGFLAAWFGRDPHDRPELIFYDEARLSAAEAYQQAIDAGAGAVIGPLLKDAVDAIAPLVGPVPVLALNTLGDDQGGPTGFWQFGLSPADEARAVALQALGAGQRRAVALAPDSEWGRRVLQAFNAEFTAGGGQLVGWKFYEAGSFDYSVPIKSLLHIDDRAFQERRKAENVGAATTSAPRHREDVDLIFLVANMSAGKVLRPQLRFFEAGDIPTYSTSAIWEEGDGAQRDLDGIMFPDGPWVVAPDFRSRTTKDQLLRHWPRGTLGASRLYALGYDAAMLLPYLGHAGSPPRSLGGVTGTLSVDHDGIVRRELVWAEIRHGLPAPLSAVLP